MSAYDSLDYERCRYCNIDLPQDNLSVMNHYNFHWRQCSVENISHFSPCAFESHAYNSSESVKSEDLEVSGHLSHSMGYQYSYSPQTEPSNLSLAVSRCSPLNLTGKSKVDSPLTSPLASPLPSADVGSNLASHSFNVHQPQIHNEDMTSDVHNSSQSFSNYCHFNQELFNMSNQLVPSVPINQLNSSCEEESELNDSDWRERKRRSERLFQCQMCNRFFHSKFSLDEHINIYHSKIIIENVNEGDHGQYIINSEATKLIQDDVSDALLDTKQYKCSICDQEFFLKEELSQHANYHEASKPYRCDICGVGLSHISALRRHMLSHSGKKSHICEICNKGFFQKCDLMRHYSIHDKQKDIECLRCKRKFTSKHFLKNHKCKVPEEDKPFKCDICGNNCSTNVAWSYHMWKHTKNPIFIPFQTKKGENQVLNVSLAAKNVLLSKGN